MWSLVSLHLFFWYMHKIDPCHRILGLIMIVLVRTVLEKIKKRTRWVSLFTYYGIMLSPGSLYCRYTCYIIVSTWSNILFLVLSFFLYLFIFSNISPLHSLFHLLLVWYKSLTRLFKTHSVHYVLWNSSSAQYISSLYSVLFHVKTSYPYVIVGTCSK